MNTIGMLESLALGILLELLVYFALRRFTRLAASQVAVILAFIVLLAYVPWAILVWPGADVFAIHLALYLITAYILGIVGAVRRGGGWHWAPVIIVGFFAFIVAVDIVFVGVAQTGITGIFEHLLPKPRAGGEVVDSRFPGTVSHAFQEKEALYNAYLEQVERQRARGWKVRKGWLGGARAGVDSVFQVQVRDRRGKPLSGARVEGRFLRPSNSELDRSFTMNEVEPGLYRVAIALPAPGIWDLVLHVRKGDDLHEVRATTSIAARDDG